MSKLSNELIAFDASHQAYLPIIKEAGRKTGWRVVPYDDESYAFEDLASSPSSALVTVLHDSSYAFANFAGKGLIEFAPSAGVPFAVIAKEG